MNSCARKFPGIAREWVLFGGGEFFGHPFLYCILFCFLFRSRQLWQRLRVICQQPVGIVYNNFFLCFQGLQHGIKNVIFNLERGQRGALPPLLFPALFNIFLMWHFLYNMYNSSTTCIIIITRGFRGGANVARAVQGGHENR